MSALFKAKKDPQDVLVFSRSLCLKFPPTARQKAGLTKIPTLLKSSQISLPKSRTLGIYPSGGFYERGSPEIAYRNLFLQILSSSRFWHWGKLYKFISGTVALLVGKGLLSEYRE